MEQSWGPGSLRRSSSVDSSIALTESYGKTQLSRWPMQEDTKKLKHQNELEVSESEMTTHNHITFFALKEQFFTIQTFLICTIYQLFYYLFIYF